MNQPPIDNDHIAPGSERFSDEVIAMNRILTHACPDCGDVHMPPSKFDPEALRAAGWGEDYIERHADEAEEKGNDNV